jgi:hypothetical protein
MVRATNASLNRTQIRKSHPKEEEENAVGSWHAGLKLVKT